MFFIDPQGAIIPLDLSSADIKELTDAGPHITDTEVWNSKVVPVVRRMEGDAK
jgi:hypothetical protein